MPFCFPAGLSVHRGGSLLTIIETEKPDNDVFENSLKNSAWVTPSVFMNAYVIWLGEFWFHGGDALMAQSPHSCL